MWQHKEMWDGTYSFIDLLDIHEMLDVREENERRLREASKD